MKKTGLLLMFLFLTFSVNAEKSISVFEMFSGAEAVLPANNANHSELTEQEKHCKTLQENVDALKGKPQHRYVAAERYKQECLNN